MLDFYLKKRKKDTMQQNIEDELKELNNKARFISCVISGEIKFALREEEELLQDLIDKGFDRLPREGQINSPNRDMGSNPDAIDYAYLTNLRFRCLSKEHLITLAAQRKKIEAELAGKDTTTLLACKRAESDREVIIDTGSKDSEVFDAAPKTEAKAFKKKLRAHKGISKRAKESSDTGVRTAHQGRQAKQADWCTCQ